MQVTFGKYSYCYQFWSQLKKSVKALKWVAWLLKVFAEQRENASVVLFINIIIIYVFYTLIILKNIQLGETHWLNCDKIFIKIYELLHITLFNYNHFNFHDIWYLSSKELHNSLIFHKDNKKIQLQKWIHRNVPLLFLCGVKNQQIYNR